jgi:hypothetical protein
VTITEEFERLLVRMDDDQSVVVVAVAEQEPVADEVERLRLATAEADARQVVYHLTAH